MASLFIATALGEPLGIGEQISLLRLHDHRLQGRRGREPAPASRRSPAASQSHRPDLVDGVGLIVGIDRFMSEARALTNFAGNAVATVLIGTWTKESTAIRRTGSLRGRSRSTRPPWWTTTSLRRCLSSSGPRHSNLSEAQRPACAAAPAPPTRLQCRGRGCSRTRRAPVPGPQPGQAHRGRSAQGGRSIAAQAVSTVHTLVTAVRSSHCRTLGPPGSQRLQKSRSSTHLAIMAAWRSGHSGTGRP